LDAIWNLFSFQSKKPKNNTGLPERSISHDGLERYFLEKQPANFQPSSPLVILLHGGTNSMYDLFDKPSIALWLQLSDQNGFLLLAPNGTQRRKLGGGYDTSGTNQVWNDFRYATDVDDVGFLAALVEWARTQRSIDPKRVYVTGASNGGMMTHRMILERPELFAAGAGFIANLVENDPVGVPPSQIPPLLIMNGNQDPLMPWNGGSIANDRGRVRSALATRDYFVSTAKADPSAVVTSTLLDVDPNDGCILRSEYYPPLPLMGPITSSAPIQFYTMDGGGHTIPYMGSVASDTKSFGVVCKDVYGVDLVWKFLSTYTRP
jgi:polyhydroxybutyrate depolymerase